MQKNRLISRMDNAEWKMTVENKLECVTQQDNFNITMEDPSIHFNKMPHWKVPGRDGLHGSWQKNFTSFYQAMVKHLDVCIQTGDVRNWMVESRTVLIQKDARKGNVVSNYKSIA